MYETIIIICFILLFVLLTAKILWQRSDGDTMKPFPAVNHTSQQTDSSTNLQATEEAIAKSVEDRNIYRMSQNIPSYSLQLPKIFNSEASDDPHIYEKSHYGRFDPDAMGKAFDEPDKTIGSEDILIHGLNNYPQLTGIPSITEDK